MERFKITADEHKELQLEIIKIVDDFCKMNKLTYFLAYGTLIGSIRHKGYIPWDDDIDIVMPREDYMKFISTFNLQYENPKVLSNLNDDRFPYAFAKVSNNDTHLDENLSLSYPMGVNIDVFPLDGLPDSIEETIKHFRKVKFYRYLLVIRQLKRRKGRGLFKELVISILKTLTFFVNYQKTVQKINMLATKYSFGSSKYVANIVHGHGMSERVEKSVFNNSKFGEFEGHLFCIPGRYDEWLTRIYGNYMELPPEEKRISHHYFSAFWK